MAKIPYCSFNPGDSIFKDIKVMHTTFYDIIVIICFVREKQQLIDTSTSIFLMSTPVYIYSSLRQPMGPSAVSAGTDKPLE